MRRSVLLAVLIGVACVACIVYVATRAEKPAAAAHGPSPAVPVLAAKAETKAVPILLRGLGTVTAYNTVGLKSRVEGAITAINFKEGQAVKKNDLLIQLDPRPYQAALDQAKSTLIKDQAALANAKTDLARYGDLLKRNFAPEQQVATQQTTVSQDEAAGASDTAMVEAAQLNVDYAALRSPIDGVTGIRQVDIGNLIQANSAQTLVTITQIKPIYVIFTLPESEIDRVRRAMAKGPLPVQAFAADDRTKVAEGVLDLIDNTVDATTGTVKLKAEFKNDDTALWPGQFVNAHAILDTITNGVTVPASAVQTGPKGPFTYVINDKSEVELRPLTILQTEANRVLVGSGVALGEQVVTAGQFKLAPGTKVKVSSELADAGQTLTDAPVGTDVTQ